MKNINELVVSSFGEEWDYYKQDNDQNLLSAFNQYFNIFPVEYLNSDSEGFDMGCGSGRWAKYIAPKVKVLNCIEPSQKALNVAKKNLKEFNNCQFECASSNTNSIVENSQDFGYCLGVLHHTPDPQIGLNNCVSKLKKGCPFLLYLYYNFDNRPFWYRLIWLPTNLLRKVISSLPFNLKLPITKLIALLVYLPLARLGKILSLIGINAKSLPLFDYKDKSFYFMQTDSFDRFSTKIEKRFSKEEITRIMELSGLEKIIFSEGTPFWVALGYKK